MATEELVCEKSNHKWTREVKRGRKPKNCNNCNEWITKEVMSNTSELPMSIKLTGFCNTGDHHRCDGLILASPGNKIKGWRCPCECHNGHEDQR